MPWARSGLPDIEKKPLQNTIAQAVSVEKPAFTQAAVPPVTFRKSVKPSCSSKLVAALER
jgi:hypothetical protein